MKQEENKQQLNEIAPLVVAGAAILAGIAAAEVATFFYYSSADPDVKFILKNLSKTDSEEIKKLISAYQESYKTLVSNMGNFFFAPEAVVTRKAEWIPFVNFKPGSPSIDAQYRAREVVKNVNSAIMNSDALSSIPLNVEKLKGALEQIILPAIENEYRIIRDAETLDRAPKDESGALSFMKQQIDSFAQKASEINSSMRGASQQIASQKQAPQPEAGKPASTGGVSSGAGASGVAAAAQTAAPAYKPNTASFEDVLANKARYQKGDKTLATGPIGLIQSFLTNAGYSIGSDGYFGKKTEDAVKAFQEANGLIVDGLVGTKTLQKLMDISISKEVADAAAGKGKITKISLGKLGELEADMNIPPYLLKKKVEKLSAAAQQEPENAKLQARLDRAEKRLAMRGLGKVTRQARKAIRKGDIKVIPESIGKKFITLGKLRTIIKEEVTRVLNEQPVTNEFIRNFDSVKTKFDMYITGFTNRQKIEDKIKSLEALEGYINNDFIGPDRIISQAEFEFATQQLLKISAGGSSVLAGSPEAKIVEIKNRILMTLQRAYNQTLPKTSATKSTATKTQPAKTLTCASLEAVRARKAVLKKGINNCDSVATVQQLLKDKMKLDKLQPDGDFGSATEFAVQSFQKQKGLSVDGIVGSKTLAALEAQEAVSTPATAAAEELPAAPPGVEVEAPTAPVTTPIDLSDVFNQIVPDKFYEKNYFVTKYPNVKSIEGVNNPNGVIRGSVARARIRRIAKS